MENQEDSYNLRFPGQYYDAETGLNQNTFRDYDPLTAKYVQSDPIGLKAGINTYAYVGSNPVGNVDPLGLAKMCCRYLDSIAGSWHGIGLGKRHCYIKADDGNVYGLYPQSITWDFSLGVPRVNDPRDRGGQCYDCPGKACANQNECLRKTAEAYPIAQYSTIGANSNTFAGHLAGSCCKGGIPSGVHDAPSVSAAPPTQGVLQ